MIHFNGVVTGKRRSIYNHTCSGRDNDDVITTITDQGGTNNCIEVRAPMAARQFWSSWELIPFAVGNSTSNVVFNLINNGRIMYINGGRLVNDSYTDPDSSKAWQFVPVNR
jgi:hypothetical protein